MPGVLGQNTYESDGSIEEGPGYFERPIRYRSIVCIALQAYKIHRYSNAYASTAFSGHRRAVHAQELERFFVGDEREMQFHPADEIIRSQGVALTC